MVGRKVGAVVVLAVLACARPADAGWLDFIWEMTGPQMVGFGIECEVGIARNPDRGCIIPGWRFSNANIARGEKPQDHWFWVSTGAFYYVSTDEEFTSSGVRGFGVDPMVLFSRFNDKRTIRVTAGAGLTVQRFWSDDFEAFGNSGFKFRPLAVDFPVAGRMRLNVAYNLRYFWDGFESSPAVEGTPTTPRIPAVFRKGDQAETVHALGFTVTF